MITCESYADRKCQSCGICSWSTKAISEARVIKVTKFSNGVYYAKGSRLCKQCEMSHER